MLQSALLGYGTYLLLFFALDIPFLPWFNALVLGVIGLALWLLNKGYLHVSLGIMSVGIVGHSFVATLILGWHANFQIFGFLVLLFLMLCPEYSARLKLIIFAMLAGSYALFEANIHHFMIAHQGDHIHLIRSLNSLVFCGNLAFLAHIYAEAINASTRDLHALNIDLTRLATTDGLTGLLNRRSLREQMQQEIVRFNRTARTFSVVLGDIDHFKSINDAHGHQGGDEVLREAARIVRETARTQDLVARWGGEEFCLFLPETNANEAEAMAQRIRERFNREPIIYAGKPLDVRMTLGLTEYHPGQTLDDVLLIADRALYAGKAAGRNCVKRGP